MARRRVPSTPAGSPEKPSPTSPEPAPPPAGFWTRLRVALAVVLLLAIHGALEVRSLLQENATVDEVAHMPAGVSYWQTGTFKLYHHNPPLDHHRVVLSDRRKSGWRVVVLPCLGLGRLLGMGPGRECRVHALVAGHGILTFDSGSGAAPDA